MKAHHIKSRPHPLRGTATGSRPADDAARRGTRSASRAPRTTCCRTRSATGPTRHRPPCERSCTDAPRWSRGRADALFRRGVKGASHRKLCGVLTCPRCGPREPPTRQVLLRVRQSTGAPRLLAAGGAQGRHGAVLRPRRVHRRLGGGRPRGRRAGSSPVSRAAQAEIERYGGTVEKFIGDAVDGRLRRPGRARGRPRTGGPGRRCGSSRRSRS